MANTVTLGELKSQIRALTDMEGAFEADTNRFVDDAELEAAINASGRLWYGMVVQAIPERFEAQQSITSGYSSVSLPASHYKTLGVHFQYSNGSTYPLDRIQYQQRYQYKGSNYTGRARGYYLTSDSLVLLPTPTSGTYLHDYIPGWTLLSDDADTVDGYAGWEQWIVYDVASKLRIKEEAGVNEILSERERIKRDILEMAQDRELITPMAVQNVQDRDLLGIHLNPDFWLYR